MLLPHGAHAHCQYITRRRMQHGVGGEIDENRQSMSFAAAEHDEVNVAVARDPDNVGFDVSYFDLAVRVGPSEFGGKRGEARLRARDQLILDLYRGDQGFTHRLERHELDYMQEFDLRIAERCDGLCPAANRQAVVIEIDDHEDATIERHIFPRCAEVKPTSA